MEEKQEGGGEDVATTDQEFSIFGEEGWGQTERGK